MKRKLSHNQNCDDIKLPKLEFENSLDTLFHIQQNFIKECDLWKIPRIIFQHQLYSCIGNRTLVDKQIEDLRKELKIVLFKLRPDLNEISIMFLDDFINHIKLCTKQSPLIDSFIEKIVCSNPSFCYSRELLRRHSFDEEDIVKLVAAGILAVREAGSWWLSVPNSGIFFKNLELGRKNIISIFKRMRFKEILLQDLIQRPFKKLIFGFSYHYHDLVGSDTLKKVSTSSGILLRL